MEILHLHVRPHTQTNIGLELTGIWEASSTSALGLDPHSIIHRTIGLASCLYLSKTPNPFPLSLWALLYKSEYLIPVAAIP